MPTKREPPEDLRNLRLPTSEERRELNAQLKLTDKQSARLWCKLESMCELFVEHWQLTPRPGGERRALRQRMGQLSRHLAAAEAAVAALSPLQERIVARRAGPVLAAMLNEEAFWPAGNGPLDAFSIHDLDLLECWVDPKTGEHEGVDRVSANRFLKRVVSAQFQRRQNAGPQEAIRLLRGLLHTINRPIGEFVELSGGGKGGAPAKLYRDAAVRRLADLFEEITGTPPTTSVGGAFMTFADQILINIGISTDGLEDAVKRTLRDRHA